MTIWSEWDADYTGRGQETKPTLFGGRTMKRLLAAVVAGCALAMCLAGVAESQCQNGQCPGGVCPTRQAPQWRGAQQMQPHPFVCRIYNKTVRRDGVNEFTIGSGTLVCKGLNYGVVLTCAHLFDEGTGRLSVRFPGGTNYAGTVIVKNRQHDLAFIKLTPRPSEAIATMAPEYVKQGDRVTHAGYGRTGQYTEISGSVIGYVLRGSGKAEVLNVTGGSRQGDSGGPILNAQGELVGVLATTNGKSTQGIFNGRICAFAMENRYVFPWNADLAAKKDKNKLEANRPVVPVEPVKPIEPPPLPQQPPVDLSGVNQRLGNLESQQAEQLKMIDTAADRMVPLEATASKARQLAEQWPELQAALKTLEQTTAKAGADASTAVGAATEAVAGAADAKAAVDAALDEEAPDGLLAKVKARLESTVTAKIAAKLTDKVGWQGLGIAGLAIAVIVWLVRRDILDKIKTGDPLFIEKIAARTRNEVDDRIAARIGSRIETHADPNHGWREELADLKGMVAGLTGPATTKSARK